MGLGEELIWVDKGFAEKWKELNSAKASQEKKIEVFEEYMKTVSDAVKSDFRASLDNLEEDAAIFTGLMLKVKQAFGKAKDEHMEASYALWEKFDAEIPSVKEKVDSVIKTLKPLQAMIKDINDMMANINTHHIDNVLSAIGGIAATYGQQREMIDFLVQNFRRDQP